jgi:hypothetical protein
LGRGGGKPRLRAVLEYEAAKLVPDFSRRAARIHAVRIRSERLKDAISQAYLQKYHTPGSIKYARDLGRAKSRATTTELAPL